MRKRERERKKEKERERERDRERGNAFVFRKKYTRVLKLLLRESINFFFFINLNLCNIVLIENEILVCEIFFFILAT